MGVHVTCGESVSSCTWHFMSHICVTHICHTWMSHVTHIGMRHVTHMPEACLTYTWVTSQISMRHVTHINKTTGCGCACDRSHTYGCVMSHIWTRLVSHMHESRHTYERVTSHIWMRHVTHRIWVRMRHVEHRCDCIHDFVRTGPFWWCVVCVSKEPYIVSKEPCIQSKEPYIRSCGVIEYMILCGQAPFDGALCAYQKSPISYQQSPIFNQKSPIFNHVVSLHTWFCADKQYLIVCCVRIRRALYSIKRVVYAIKIKRALCSIKRALYSIMWCHCIHEFVRKRNLWLCVVCVSEETYILSKEPYILSK